MSSGYSTLPPSAAFHSAEKDAPNKPVYAAGDAPNARAFGARRYVGETRSAKLLSVLMRARAPELPAPTPLQAVALGALSTVPWVLFELARESSLSLPALITASCVCALFGGGAALLTHRLTRAATLVPALLLPPLLISAKTIVWAIERANALRLPTNLLWEILFGLGAGASAAAIIKAWLAPRRLRTPVAIVVGLFVAICALPLAHRVESLLALLGPLCSLALALLVLYRFPRPWLAGLAALLMTICLHRIDPVYPEIRRLLGLLTVSLSVLTVRFALRVHHAQHDARGVMVALLVLSCAAIGGELQARATSAAFRSRTSALGLSGALAQTLQAMADLDGDGYGVILGQRDCAPYDARISPDQHELARNGVDDNCRAGDLREARSAISAWVRARERVHPPPPTLAGDIVLVVIDTLRYDDAQSKDLHALRELERHGLAYDRAYATASFTVQSLAALLSMRLPSAYTYTWSSPHDAMPNDVGATLLTELTRLGYDVGIAGGLRPKDGHGIFGPSGYGQGARVTRLMVMDTPAEQTTAAALEVLGLLASDKPRFLYVHYMALHAATRSREQYQEALRSVDASLAPLRAALPDALWLLTADHGESFGLHARVGHSTQLFEEVMHVPLILSWPGAPVARIGAVSSLRSITPTLLAMTGRMQLPEGAGPYLCVAPGACRDSIALMALERPTLHLHGAIIGHQQILRDLRADHVFAYDLAHDPDEKTPLPSVPPALLRELEGWEERIMRNDPVLFWPYRE